MSVLGQLQRGVRRLLWFWPRAATVVIYEAMRFAYELVT